MKDVDGRVADRMNLFNRKRAAEPAANPVRETLFGDMPLERWPDASGATEARPWASFVAARAALADGRVSEAKQCWREVIELRGLESRHYLQAWHFLRQRGEPPPAGAAKQVLGVVVEVGMRGGLDLLAAYADRTARYYNYAGSAVVWEHPDDSLDARIDELLAAAAAVVRDIGPWAGSRPAAPVLNQVRLSFLTPSGLHFGEGAIDVLSNDPRGGRVLGPATALMHDLIAKASVR